MDLNSIVKYTHSLKVLFIEDDIDLLEHLTSILENLFSTVDTSNDGQQALNLYNKFYETNNQFYDIILTDIELPHINGLNLIESMLELNPTQHVVVISAYNDSDKLEKLLSLGIDNFLHKPIDFKVFFETLKKCAIPILEQREMLSKLNNVQEINYNLESVMDIINQVAIVSKTDLEGIITYVNDIFCNTSQYSKEELVGKNHNILRHHDMPSIVFKHMWEEIQDGKIWKGKLKNRAKDGSSYYVNANIFPIFNTNNEIKEYIAIRFLTTNEEVKNREFKKKVLEQYQESKRRDFTSRRMIDELKKQLIKYENFDLLEFSLKKMKKKSLECTSQLNFTENKNKNLEVEFTNYKKNVLKNVSAILEKNKRLQMKSDVHDSKVDALKEEIKTREGEFKKMLDTNEQRAKEIEDLRDVIKHLEEEDN